MLMMIKINYITDSSSNLNQYNCQINSNYYIKILQGKKVLLIFKIIRENNSNNKRNALIQHMNKCYSIKLVMKSCYFNSNNSKMSQLIKISNSKKFNTAKK